MTDAPLEAGAPLEEPICDDCGVCVKNCPAGAVHEDGSFDPAACSVYLFGGLNSNEILEGLEERSLDGLRESVRRIGKSARGWMMSFAEGRRLFYNCGNCVRLCTAHVRYKKKRKNRKS